MEYRPAASVRVAVLVPATVTVTAVSGSPVVASVTVPETVTCCAASGAGSTNALPTRASRATHSSLVPQLGRDLFMFPSFVLLGMGLADTVGRARTDRGCHGLRATRRIGGGTNRPFNATAPRTTGPANR